MRWGPYSSSAAFELPIASDKLFLLSGGSASGAVKVVRGGDGDIARVGVIANYKYQNALERVKVCTINRGDGENGVGIFVSDKKLKLSNSEDSFALPRLRIGLRAHSTCSLTLRCISQRLVMGQL